MDKIDYLLNSLSKSKFRNSFHLKEKDKIYVKEKGIDTIKEHTIDFINKRLKNNNIPNDGKQTPMRGHPTFIAQHATGTCCRGCLNKIHKIEKDKELTEREINYITEVILRWINRELNK